MSEQIREYSRRTAYCDVALVVDADGWVCVACRLAGPEANCPPDGRDVRLPNLEVVSAHLRAHRDSGDQVPLWVLERVERERVTRRSFDGRPLPLARVTAEGGLLPPEPGAPRGSSLLRAAYPAFNVKLQVFSDYVEHARKFVAAEDTRQDELTRSALAWMTDETREHVTHLLECRRSGRAAAAAAETEEGRERALRFEGWATRVLIDYTTHGDYERAKRANPFPNEP